MRNVKFITSRLASLRRILVEKYGIEELEILCGDLDVMYDNLAGQSKEAKAHALLIHLNRRCRILDLIATARAKRPDINWDDVTRDIGPSLPCFGNRCSWPPVVLVAGAALAAILALLVLALAAGSIRPDGTPTPTPPATFPYQVRVLAEETGASVRGAEVIVELNGAPPMVGRTGSDGVALFHVDAARGRQSARLIVEVEGYQPFSQTVNLIPASTKDVLLSPVPAP